MFVRCTGEANTFLINLNACSDVGIDGNKLWARTANMSSDGIRKKMCIKSYESREDATKAIDSLQKAFVNGDLIWDANESNS